MLRIGPTTLHAWNHLHKTLCWLH